MNRPWTSYCVGVLGAGWTQAGALLAAFAIAAVATRLPEALIRRMAGAAVIAVGVRYLWSGLDLRMAMIFRPAVRH
jgi:uncharacterized membrane protein YfcA